MAVVLATALCVSESLSLWWYDALPDLFFFCKKKIALPEALNFS